MKKTYQKSDLEYSKFWILILLWPPHVFKQIIKSVYITYREFYKKHKEKHSSQFVEK
jgi:hypothetical protein